MVEILITGATGFVGRHLLKELLQLEDVTKVYVFVRDENKFNKLLNNLNEDALHKICVLKGDITKKELGLSKDDLIKISKISEVYHLAATISLSNSEKSKDHIFTTNLDGTVNLLELIKDNKHLSCFYFFSSAYSCGVYTGQVHENWINKPELFRCHYEESKWLSENMIKKYHENFNVPYVLLRPSVILDDLNTNIKDADKYSVYLFGQSLKRILEGSRNLDDIRIKGLANSELNFITVSSIIKIILEIRRRKIKNKVFNLTNRFNTPGQSVLEGIKEGINLNGKLLLSESLEEKDMTKTEEIVYKMTKIFIPYMSIKDIYWEMENTDVQMKLNLTPITTRWLKTHIVSYLRHD